MTKNNIEIKQNIEWNIISSAILYQFGNEAIHFPGFNKGYCDSSFGIWLDGPQCQSACFGEEKI
jgi:hypothetical protein